MPTPSARRTTLAVLAGAALLGAAAFGALRVRFDDDPLSMLPADDPEVREFRAAAGPFGMLDTLLIGVERDDLFAKDSLDRLRKFARDAAMVPGVAEVVCFTEVPLIKAGTSTTEVADLVPRPIPEDPARLDAVRREVLANGLVVGNLVAADGSAALIPVRLDPAARPERETAREVADLAQRLLEGGRIYVDGAPGAALAVSTAQTSAAPLLGLLVAAVLLLVPFVSPQRTVPHVLALAAAGVSAAAALCPAAALGRPLASSALVALVAAAGSTFALASFVLRADGTAAARARGAGPVAQGVAAWTAIAALGALLAGAADAAFLLLAGGLANLALAALVLPALAGASRPATAGAPAPGVPRARPALALVLTLACAAAYVGVPRLRAAVEPGEAFRPGSGPHEAEQFLLRHFDGTATLVAAVHGDIATPEALDALRALESAALAEPAVLSVTSLLGAVRTQGKAYGRASELPPGAEGVRKFFWLAEGQPGLGQLVRPSHDAAAVLVKIDPRATVADAVHVRDVLSGTVPGATRYRLFADADEPTRARMVAELVDRLGSRLARLDIASDRRTPALLRDLLDRTAAPAGPDEAALRSRIGEHFADGTTWVLVKDLETEEPLPVGTAEAAALAARIAAAGKVDEDAVRTALVAVFPPAAGDDIGLKRETEGLVEALSRVSTEGESRTRLPPFVQAWALAETGDPDRAERAEAEILAASSELRDGGIALPGDGVPLAVRVGGMPLAAPSVRAATIRGLTTAFLAAAVLGLVLWVLLFLVGDGGESRLGTAACATGWTGTMRCLGRAIPVTIVPLVAASLAFGGAGLLGLPGDPGLPVTFASAVLLAGTLASLLLLPAAGTTHGGAASWWDARRTAWIAGPVLAAIGFALTLIPLPPARTLGLCLAASCLAALGLGWAHAGRR
ncbi:MAG: hypothetical protein HY907_07720 [Deltaproteobacteria bacterium]|nr:hypothetical protein [Deltaproteobacteria bacterium]